MVRILNAQASHTYGVLDPLVIERRDTKFVQASLADARNVIMLPQGGYVDRGGTDRITLLRRRLTDVELTTAMLSAPNGGTVANLTDDDDATMLVTAAVGASPFVVLEIDLGSATNLCAVDLNDFSAADSRDDCLHVQWLDGATWRNICDPFHIRTLSRNRRFATAPSAGNISARYLRVTVTGGAGPGAVTLGGVAVWRETNVDTDAVVRSFNYLLGTSYQLIFSHRNIDVFKDGQWQAAIATGWTDSMVRAIKRETDYDTVLLFHQTMHTLRLVRQGSDREWNADNAPFENLPRTDYGGSYTNGVNEVQRVSLFDLSGGTFQLILDGKKTREIDGATISDRATDACAALEALTNVEPGLTCTVTGTKTFTVEFTGGKNAARDWQEMSGIPLNPSAYVAVSTQQEGRAAGEDVMSGLRGWPAAGRYAQERLLLGGITSAPGTYLASVPGEPFNIDTELGGAAAALVFDIGGEQSQIRDFYIGHTVLIFTDGGVYHLASPKISAEEAPELKRSDAPGIDANLPPLSLGDAVYYVQAGGESIVMLNYNELSRNFLGDNASVLSAFLVKQPKDWTIRRAVAGNDADLLMYINGDGKLVTLTLMRSQEVSGFAPHETEGQFVSIATDGAQNVWLICKRNMGGTDRLMLERMQPDKHLDSAVNFSFALPTDLLAGLQAFEGQSVHVWADGKWAGAFTVQAGNIVLPKPVRQARVGYWTAPFATDTPFHPEDNDQRPMSRYRRVFGVALSVLETDAVAVAANGGQAVAAPLNSAFSGTVEMEGFPGFTRDAQVTVTQTRPGRLKVRSVKKKVAA